jgi:hypothetical protein
LKYNQDIHPPLLLFYIMMATQRVFVVAPHICYPQVRDPGCDIKSKRAAAVMQDAFPGSLLLMNSLPRYVKDQNRLEGRNGPLRVALRNQAHQDDYVIEVHSYPNNHEWAKIKGKPRFIVMLATYSDAHLSSLEQYILNALDMEDVMVQGDPFVNDIAVEARNSGWNHVLLEFNDDITIDQLIQKVRKIADAVSQHMLSSR